MTAFIPVFMVIIGVLVYALSNNAKVQEIGRIVLAAGLFSIAFAYATRLVTFLGK